MSDWSEFNGNLAAQRYSPLDQINAGNVGKLQIAWRWQAGMFGPSPELKNVSSPLVVDGMMYATVGTTRDVVGIDAGHRRDAVDVARERRRALR